MIRVVVIDDQPLVSQSIIQSIPWDRLGCKVVGSAVDGLAGKELIKKHKPDIVITDIRMPLMDGLDLIDYATSIIPDSKFIIITGYDQFSYAQKAIKLHAFDLILKPIDNNALIQVIQSAVKEIYKTRREQAMQQNSLIREKSSLVEELITGIPPQRDIMESRARKLGMMASQYILVIIRPAHARQPFEFQREAKFSDSLGKILFELKTTRHFDSVDCNIMGNHIIIFFTDRASVSDSVVYDIGKEISRQLHEKGVSDCTVSTSDVFFDIWQTKRAYQQAYHALRFGFYLDQDCIGFHQIHGLEMSEEKPDFTLFQGIYKLLSEPGVSRQSLCRQLDEVYESLMQHPVADTDYLKYLFIGICMASLNVFSRSIGFGVMDLGKTIQSITAMQTLRGVYKCCYDLILSIYDAGQAETNLNYNAITHRALHYIEDHYAESISLSKIASLISVTESHLSRIIKKDTGKNFVDILNECRIKHAIHLLQTTDYRINEVGEKVGIPNYAYFYQRFKKVIGCPPKEYKNLLAGMPQYPEKFLLEKVKYRSDTEKKKVNRPEEK